MRDQIIFGTSRDEIREEALRKAWDLDSLRKEGMRLESASKGASEIAGDARVNRLGKYSHKAAKRSGGSKAIGCFYCGLKGPRQTILLHAKQCPAKSATCSRCNKAGHVDKACNEQPVRNVDPSIAKLTDPVTTVTEDVYNVNLFRVKDEAQSKDADHFKVDLLINNHLDKVLADTGAAISVCSVRTAKKWGLLDKMSSTRVQIKPYGSESISAIGASKCGVSFGDRTVPVQWHIIDDDCEPILAGKKSEHLGIVRFRKTPDTLMPINMIKLADTTLKSQLQDVIASTPEIFNGIGCLKNHVVKLPVDGGIKPVAEPPRRVPYHLVSRVQEEVDKMLEAGVIEEQTDGQHAPWVSNMVIVPKPDGDLRITLDAHNVNKALLSSNFPIPRQEDIKAKLSGKKVFSKLDLRAAFWQLELDTDARMMTVFHAGGKLYRYKRLVMGLKPSQGELNSALQPLFSHLPEVHVIHDDIVVATENEVLHVEVMVKVLGVLSRAGLTLNQEKCTFGAHEIRFWGLLISAEGVRPDPVKVEALDHLITPKNKEELVSFLCMMQSNADFIPGFSKKAAFLRELTKKNARFRWNSKHDACFKELVASFRGDALLRFFDCEQPTFVFVDGHTTGLGAMLAQGTSIEEAKPIAIASRTTTPAEGRYPQLDIEALSVDFALSRFREYLVGSPTPITVVTDHKPLVSIFNGRRNGSIRTQRIKLKHQDIPFVVEYQKGKLNQSDYLSRHAKDFSLIPDVQQKEADEFSNLLYTLHTTPVVDHISLARISKQTETDEVLSKLAEIIRKGSLDVGRNQDARLKKFKPILSELSLTGNGIILKGERMVLPESLQGMAIELAHRGSHPGRAGIERRLRYHFFFHGMYDKVKNFVEKCEECCLFVDKKTKEPIQHHKIPRKAWETVAVDLFGPMPSSRHVVVVQDIGSRFPAAKLVSSTKADKVIPILDEIYTEYGYPDTQISDNGPPFNSIKMRQYNESHGIAAQFSTPYTPSQNPAETFMKRLEKP